MPAMGSTGITATGSLVTGEDGTDVPLWKFHNHTAAVKALAWDPHISGVLASGGGTADKHIRFWNVLNGSMLNELDTGSQVRLEYFLQIHVNEFAKQPGFYAGL